MEAGEAEAVKARFLSFVMSLGMQGMADLGKLPQASTGKIGKNLDGAGSIIALLEMLEAKTKGNLARDEASMLATTLSNLRMNFVDELEAAKKREGSSEKDGESAGDGVEDGDSKSAPGEQGA